MFLGINPCVGGMNYHDPAAVLLSEAGEMWAVEEERFSGKKSAPGVFPLQSIRWCLEQAGVTLQDIEALVVPYDPGRFPLRAKVESELARRNGKPQAEIEAKSTRYTESFLRGTLLKALSEIGPCPPIRFCEHHLAHALSAYHVALNEEEMLAVVIDGVGEVSTASIYRLDFDGHELLYEDLMPNSLGYFYALATAFLGFRPWRDEGKLMALAPWGKPDLELRKKLERIAGLHAGGWDVAELISGCITNGLMLDVARGKEELGRALGFVSPRQLRFDDQLHRNFAFEVQRVFELAIIAFVSFWLKRTGIKRICAAGGVFLNCKMNGQLRQNSEVAALYVQPVSSDSGLALGAALYGKGGWKPRQKPVRLSLGPRYHRGEIAAMLEKVGVAYICDNTVEKKAATALSEGKIGFWFEGGAEFGPRALGSRSIIADPRQKEISDFVNANIKGRELWRPFACSIMSEYAAEVLENYRLAAPYMIMAYSTKGDWAARVPGVVHIDNTTRPQVVFRDSQPSYHRLISGFHEITRIPMLLNTSLNGRNQPLCRTPLEAVELFNRTSADFCVLEGLWIEK